jgi:hypothetical protein
MSTGGVVAIVIGAVVILFLAVNRGLINSGVQISPTGAQRGIVAPQPAQNYGGYLAATTAPAVSSAVSSLISLGNGALTSWMRPANSPTPVAQGGSVASPSLAAQPQGPAVTYYNANITPIGPVVSPDLGYVNTNQAAFDYVGLANDNGFDINASLEQNAGVYGA